MSVLPKILGVHTVTKSRLFNIEGVDLNFFIIIPCAKLYRVSFFIEC